jgi:2',3'-cyclic-nucleotide 2'-phosphodiesterase
MEHINVLCIGDIVGNPGRIVLRDNLKEIQNEYKIDFTIANVENSAAGFGITEKIYYEFMDMGIDALTSGNHIYRNKSIMAKFNSYNNLLRPLNFPNGNPGKGYKVFHEKHKIAVINVIGRAFLESYDCPFQAMKSIIEDIKQETPIVIVDFHAEATSEKQAMGWFLDGKASLVFGTHTHIMTADERLLQQGTSYITDIGMVGAYDSILGMEKDPIIKKFFTQMPTRFEPAQSEKNFFNGIVCKIDPETGKSTQIKRIQKLYNY